MPEHLIRLRGGWELWPGDGPSRRVALPSSRPLAVGGAVRLVRAFRRPPLEEGVETLLLSIEDAPGLDRVELNGEVLAEGTWDADARRLALPGTLPDRNLLTLRAMPSDVAPDRGGPWGSIALVIVRRDAAVP